MFTQLTTKRQVLRWLTAGALISMLGACAPVVRSDYDSKVAISSYHTYSWEQRDVSRRPSSQAFDNPINEKRLRDAVAAKLAERGLQPAAEGTTADCVVNVAIGSRPVADPGPNPRWSFGLGWGWGRRGYGSILADEDYVYYRESRISVNLFDAKTRDPIWHAAVDTDVTTLTGDNADARIKSAVDSMFKKYPSKL